ncbi:MAG: crossover junction endodeoxyribonuclease RuvC [Rhodospirillales bacterium RIFCSPLOWO2_12_FULL_58_28]|nr:MAG: crossover junction endodeoxyribonuclease RuvC [Rhodospirillales bacterium RIFCSPLOWO2_02_FULL_58_16]OHC78536.1 MAG: crossover junction endodeoxyribonuclease RuvC [Rhodospirillales bacterium RIFCSPLOWO2_12_FULL_58_28]
MRFLGIDPGLGNTGWGVIDVEGNRLSHVANGVIGTGAALPLAERLVQIKQGLERVIETYNPCEAAVEETFVNNNPASTLKLGQARGVAILVPADAGILVAEYTPNRIKKAVVGAGHAAKEQIQMMVRILLPGCDIASADAADALAVAICHAHYRETARRIAPAEVRS